MGAGVIRIAVGAVFAVIVTFALFGLMRALIFNEGGELEEKRDNVQISITSTREISDVITRQDRPEQPDETKTPPPPPRIEAAKSELPNEGMASFLGSLPDIDPDTVGSSDIAFVVADRDEQPLVRIPPQYPQRAAERGLEGSCDLTFDILPDGTIDGGSIQADCTSSLFSREATRAVERWRYAPRIVDGQPVIRRGWRTTLEFTLED
ncbi:MAG: TonB family protein [Maricaulaceae bacterium]|jgi:protein TonB